MCALTVLVYVVVSQVRYIGVSNETSYGVCEFVHAAKTAGLPRLQTIQNCKYKRHQWVSGWQLEWQVQAAHVACVAFLLIQCLLPLPVTHSGMHVVLTFWCICRGGSPLQDPIPTHVMHPTCRSLTALP